MKKKITLRKKIEEFVDDVEEWYEEVDDAVEEALDQIYEKVPGRYFGLVGFALYVLSTFISLLIYVSADSSYSIFTHWISHLGDGPSGANNVFNIGWIVSSFFLFFFYVYEIRTLRKKRVKEYYLDVVSLTTLSFAVGILLIGIFPLHLTVLHTIAAMFYFVGRFGFTVIYGYIVIKTSEVPNALAFAAFTTALFYLLYFLSPVITIYTSQIGITRFFLEWLTLLVEFILMVMILMQQFHVTR